MLGFRFNQKEASASDRPLGDRPMNTHGRNAERFARRRVDPFGTKRDKDRGGSNRLCLIASDFLGGKRCGPPICQAPSSRFELGGNGALHVERSLGHHLRQHGHPQGLLPCCRGSIEQIRGPTRSNRDGLHPAPREALTLYHIVKTAAFPLITEVRIYDETLDHIRENHPEVPIDFPSLMDGLSNTICHPTHVESGKRTDTFVFVSVENTNASGDPFRVPIKVIEGTSGLLKTAFFATPENPLPVVWRAK